MWENTKVLIMALLAGTAFVFAIVFLPIVLTIASIIGIALFIFIFLFVAIREDRKS